MNLTSVRPGSLKVVVNVQRSSLGEKRRTPAPVLIHVYRGKLALANTVIASAAQYLSTK
jgi:hypothetical protein